MLKVLSLFSGIGAFESALTNIGVDYEISNFCEIDKYAVKCYCKLHNTDEDKNLEDITKVDLEKLPKEIDLLTHGSPCTSFSLAGKQLGGDEGSGTPSSLLWYSVKIIEKVRPKYVVWENVKNVLSKKHVHNFNKYLSVMTEMGYRNMYIIYNSKYFGVPQNRERIYVVSIRKDIENDFDWKNIKVDYNNVKVSLLDILENEKDVDKKYFFDRNIVKENSRNNGNVIVVGQTSNKGSQGGKVYSIDGVSPTICAGTHGYANGFVLQNGIVRRFTPKEIFRLMGFKDEEYEKCKELGISDTQLYKMAGNSIVVSVLEEIFKELFKD